MNCDSVLCELHSSKLQKMSLKCLLLLLLTTLSVSSRPIELLEQVQWEDLDVDYYSKEFYLTPKQYCGRDLFQAMKIFCQPSLQQTILSKSKFKTNRKDFQLFPFADYQKDSEEIKVATKPFRKAAGVTAACCEEGCPLKLLVQFCPPNA